MYACQVCAELRFLLSQAQLKKEEAEREVRDISSKLGRQLELVEQVRETYIGHTRERVCHFFFNNFAIYSVTGTKWLSLHMCKTLKKSFDEQ